MDPPIEEPTPSRPTSRLHSAAVFCTTSFALLALGSWFAFITVNWSGSARRAVIGVAILSIVGFFAAVATTIFSAARDTYARKPPQ